MARLQLLEQRRFDALLFDGTKVFKAPTPAAAKLPLFVTVDFALGGGWTITGLNKTTTYHMRVAYVRCWVPPH